MKKLFSFCTAIVLMTSFAFASNDYKINDAAIDEVFANAQEITVNPTVISNYYNLSNTGALVQADKDRVTAGILAILLGGCGVHRFYLGHSKAGVIYIIGGLCFGLSGILGLVDGVMYLMATDDEFKTKYMTNEKVFQWIGQ